MKLTDKIDSEYQRVLLFGAPKTGKTQLAAEMAEHFNILLFDLENGYKVFRKLPPEWQERVEIVSIPDTKIYPIAIETMLKVITGKKLDICDKHGKVSCPICMKAGAGFTTVELSTLGPDWIVVVDSLSQLSNSAMNHITKEQDELYKPEWTDFRNQGSLLDKFLSQVQQAQFNIICITHEVEAELEDGRKKLVPVAGTREFSRNTAKYFDHVIYCEVKNKKHAFGSATDYGMSVLTGSRTDVKLESLAKATLLQIFRPGATIESKEVNVPTNTRVIGQQPAQKSEVSTAATNASTGLSALKAKLSGGK